MFNCWIHNFRQRLDGRLFLQFFGQRIGNERHSARQTTLCGELDQLSSVQLRLLGKLNEQVVE